MKNSEIINLEVAKKDIGLLKFIFEASEGIGLTSTLDVSTGSVIILTSPEFKPQVFEVLSSVEDIIDFKIVL